MKIFSKFVSGFTILMILSVMVAPNFAQAASVTSAKATLGRIKESVANEYGTLQFNTPTGIQAGTSDDIILTFSADFTLAAEVATNFDVELGDNVCASASFTDHPVTTTGATATDFDVDVTGDVITIEPATGVGLTAGRCFRLVWGTAATTGGTGSSSTMTNGAEDDDDTVVISGGFGDSGTITLDIIDEDQVTVTATVNQSITFDLDTSVADGENEGAQSVALGTVTVTDTRVSGTTDSINMIIAELDTNASGGAAVTVRNTNGANGLASTSVPADNIGSVDGAMLDGTENYGLCVITASVTQTSGTLAIGSPYSGNTCATNSETNDVEGLTTTGEEILNSTSAPIAGAHAEIAVQAAVSGVTVAHSDYTDTLTFVATGTF